MSNFKLENQPTNPDRKRPSKAARVAVAALAAGAVLAGIEVHNHDTTPPKPGVSAQPNSPGNLKGDSIKSSPEAVANTAQKQALSLQNEMNKMIDEGRISPLPLTWVNGTVLEQSPSNPNQYNPSYEYPIVLATANAATYDTDFNFLDGA